jgi:Leucine-rich repeat (LRR) protein
MSLFAEPDEELARALREVAQRAAYLIEVTEGQNADLPLNFPVDEFISTVRILTELPNGTQEGCREPLQHATNYLPEMRDLHFISEELEESNHKAALQRGAAIDRAVEGLLVSVMTALVRYRRIARIKPIVEKLEAPIAAPEIMTAEPIATATRLESQLSDARKEVEATPEPHSKPVEDLKRQLTDAIALSRLARIMLRMKAMIVTRYGRIVDALKNYPDLLERSFHAIRSGIDVGEEVAKRWHRFGENTVTFLADELRRTVDMLETVAIKLNLIAAGRHGARAFSQTEAQRLILNGNPPPESWWPLITKLDFAGKKLTNLESLKSLRSLKRLDLKLTSVSDLSPLAELKGLQWLDVGRTNVSDISILGNLSDLRYLDLWNTKIEDLAPLANLYNLTSLSVGATRVSDVSPLAALENLERLDLRATRVMDVSPLDYLNELQSLILSRTLVEDVTPLRGLINLQRLYLSDTKVKSVACLANLRKLQSLHLCGTAVSDLTPLERMRDLRTLELHGAPVSEESMAELRECIPGLEIETSAASPPEHL